MLKMAGIPTIMGGIPLTETVGDTHGFLSGYNVFKNMLYLLFLHDTHVRQLK